MFDMKISTAKNALRALLLGIAFSSFAPASWASVCDADIERTCGDIQPGAGALSDCIQRNMSTYSAQCREQLNKVSTLAQRLGNACINDAREFCRDVKPGYGRVKNCMVANRDKLSTGCQDALKNAGF